MKALSEPKDYDLVKDNGKLEVDGMILAYRLMIRTCLERIKIMEEIYDEDGDIASSSAFIHLCDGFEPGGTD
tara:strand:- start:78 stop:293 length:216 start_codon:yes stop_codon:yes gene_type:complete